MQFLTIGVADIVNVDVKITTDKNETSVCSEYIKDCSKDFEKYRGHWRRARTVDTKKQNMAVLNGDISAKALKGRNFEF